MVERNEYVWKKIEKEILVAVLIIGLAVAGVVYAHFNAPTVDEVSTSFDVGTGTGGTGEAAVAIPAVVDTNETNESEEIENESEEIEKTKDTDRDGLSDYQEKQIGTDPKNIDTDGDWISDKVETEIGTDPTKIDTDGDGIDDFNEYYTYPHLLNPNDPTDAKRFLEMIPNLTAKKWDIVRDGGIEGTRSVTFRKLVEVSCNDPRVQWYAERTTIEWEETPTSNIAGCLLIDGEQISTMWKQEYRCPPAYFLNKNKEEKSGGNCYSVSGTIYTLLRMKGEVVKRVAASRETLNETTGETERKRHGWVEIEIDNEWFGISNSGRLIPLDKWETPKRYMLDRTEVV